MTKDQIQPVFNRVLLELINPSETNVDVPEGSLHPDAKMVVLAIGPDVKACKVGDSVLLMPGANVLPLAIKPEKIALIHDTSIIAILS